MKTQAATTLPYGLKTFALSTFLGMLPGTSSAQTGVVALVPVEMSLFSYLVVGGLLVFSVSMLLLFQRRFRIASKELNDLTNELATTRARLTDTNQELEQSRLDHKATNERYSNILFEANVGMFQMDRAGKCTYINNALQEMSGLYPKKALKEGLESAIHPEDRAGFVKAWDAFVEGSKPFNLEFRFTGTKGQEVHVSCRANKVINAKKDVESYIGWVSNITAQHETNLRHRAETARFEYFVSETIEGFYKLVPEKPIALESDPAKMAERIMAAMVLSDCNTTFAATYGTKPTALLGKAINEFKDGCGPFKNNAAIQAFVESGFHDIDTETVRQDSNGNRLNLLNNVVGIIEDNQLVGIWGTQRNISQQKREQAEVSSQITFLRRILNSLPADVHVKDTRCRYLYASKKMADRTGIPQEEWIGKTIYEVIPGTPREHDQIAIDTMKSGKMNRVERTFEARGKNGWMETVQIPLVSDEGLVEGVVGISLDISDRKKKEDEIRTYSNQLEAQLKHTKGELAQSRVDYGKTATTLSETIQKLKVAEAERTNREHEFREHLADRKRAEETLRRSEQDLLARKAQLEEQLSKRLEELNAETDKRRKWEELLSIKEDELVKVEEHAAQLQELHTQETTLREQAEANLESTQAAMQKVQRELNEIAASREQEIERLKSDHQATFGEEHQARTRAEKQLAKTAEFLESAQEQIKRMTEQHADELEKEVAERKATAEKLIQSMEELDELRQRFSQRIEEETKSIKQELAQKQIREKAMRQHEKDLEDRIKELETTVQLKAQEYAKQLQAREGAEVEKNQIAQKMEQLTQRQQELVARETQKLHLSIAEIRLEEVKLRKRAGDLEESNEKLTNELRNRDAELVTARQELQKLEATLADTQAELKQLTGDQSKLVARETEELQRKLAAFEKTGQDLRSQIETLQEEKTQVENNLELRRQDLAKAATEYRKVVDAYKEAQTRIKQISEGQDALLARKTAGLNTELQRFQRAEKALQAKEAELIDRIARQQNDINTLNENLKAETDKRSEAERKLNELQIAFDASQANADDYLQQQTRELREQIEQSNLSASALKQQLIAAEQSVKQRDEALADLKEEQKATAGRLAEVETRLAGIREEHQAELKKSLAEVQEINRLNSELVDELNKSVQSSLNPVIKTALLLEQSDNLSEEQKRDLGKANYHCRSLVDSMNYRAELTHIADGSDEVKNAECDLHHLIADIDNQFCHRAETKKLFFAVSFAQYQAKQNVPKMVVTDESKLRKVLAILLGYALERTQKGRLGLHATRESSEGDCMNIAFELTYTPAESKDDLLNGVFGGESEGIIDLKYGLTLARQYIGMLGGESMLEYRDAGVTALTVNVPLHRSGSMGIVVANNEEKQAGAA